MDNFGYAICSFLLCLFCGSADLLQHTYLNKMRSKEYDYIIVGAGSAGSVLANRLSEDPENHVLLLEAGGLPTGATEVPFFFPDNIGSKIDWGYFTEPQEHACQAMKEKRSYFPRGKVLGGSSTINAMMYVRGNPRDFDEWEKGGATGWSWKDVLHYFKKSEDFRVPDVDDDDYHGRGGYLTVSSSKTDSPLQKAYLEAGKYLGYKIIELSETEQVGFTIPHLTVRDGLRCSTEKAFLRPASSRENLDILINAHVTKIIFDDEKRAHSVRFEWNNSTEVVRAQKEIIVSAGAIASPQLLMLSGIGPKAHLEDLGIPVVADLPVGQNLNDHIMTAAQVFLLNDSVTQIPSKILNYETIGELQHGTGPLSIPVGISSMAYVNTEHQPASEKWPDIQLYMSSSIFFPPLEGAVEDFKEENLNRNLVSIFAMLCRPEGRGFIKLRSTDPYDHPIIDPRYFTDDNDDLKRLVAGMRIVERVMSSPPLQKFGAVRIPDVLPGCEGMDPKSDDYLECGARQLTMTVYHQSGTCKMGAKNDPTTVVDPQLRVKGVKGLRVADASVMPAVTSGNTNAPTIMIGEKAADMIRGR